ncbi:CHD3-type chromatin-remodeling factor pickle-like protein, partial [Trifolium pratense]
MSSLVERLRVRSERKPIYNIDESDDDDFLVKKPGTSQEKFERIDRDDAVFVFSASYVINTVLKELEECPSFMGQRLNWKE